MVMIQSQGLIFFNPNDSWVHLPWQKGHQKSPKNQSNLKSRRQSSLQLQVWKFLRDRVYHFSLFNGENPSEFLFQFSGTMFFGKFVFFSIMKMMIHHFDASKIWSKIWICIVKANPFFQQLTFFQQLRWLFFVIPVRSHWGHIFQARRRKNKQPGCGLRGAESWGMLTEEGRKSGKPKDVNLVTQHIIVARFRLGLRLPLGFPNLKVLHVIMVTRQHPKPPDWRSEVKNFQRCIDAYVYWLLPPGV